MGKLVSLCTFFPIVVVMFEGCRIYMIIENFFYSCVDRFNAQSTIEPKLAL